MSAEKVGAGKPWYVTAAQLDESSRYCTCCGRDLTGHAIRMLELDQRNQTYHDYWDVPEDQSQGCFPFGLACAKKQIKLANAKRASTP
jgi:hypothetical protein